MIYTTRENGKNLAMVDPCFFADRIQGGTDSQVGANDSNNFGL